VHSEADRRRIQELEHVNAKQGKRLREAEALSRGSVRIAVFFDSGGQTSFEENI
jgi:hypothetical protein